tara:strand:- start:487 stop:681 length:195 start_codon:yes stop_codon:yes gene_type:complete
MANLKTKKKVYVKYIETLVRFGYDISDLLNPTYKNIDAQRCIDVCNMMISRHDEDDEKLTLENI